MTDEELKRILTNKNGALVSNWFKQVTNNQEILHYLLHKYSDKEYINSKKDLREILDRIFKNINNYPVCPICGKNCRDLYTETCGDINCMKKLRQLRNEENNLKKYGVKNQFQRKEIIDFMSTPEMQKKRENGFKERYGVINPGQVQEFREKAYKTYEEKTGYKWCCDPDFKNRVKKTMIERYGVESPLSLPKTREARKSEESLQREYETKKKNGTLNSSVAEDKIFFEIYSVFSDVIHQFRSEEYPFNCDFYIPSLDLYIEYQGFWTHGGHPFNPNNEDDLNKLEIYKSKVEKSKLYENAIETWTIRDVKKRQIAKDNNLNWIEFFTYNEIHNWIEKQRELQL